MIIQLVTHQIMDLVYHSRVCRTICLNEENIPKYEENLCSLVS